MSQTISQKRAAAVKEAENLVAATKGAELSESDSARLTELVAEVKGYDEHLEKAREGEALVNAVKALGAEPEADAPGRGTADVAAKTIGAHFVKHLGARIGEAKGGRFSLAAPEFKAATDTQVTGGHTGAFEDWLVDIDRTIQREKRERLVIADLLGKGTLSGTAVKYFLEGAFEGDFETIAEGGSRPQVHVVDPTEQIDSVKKIAAFIENTDEVFEDLPFWVSEINNRLLYRLGVKEEMQLLKGDGLGNNVLGLLNRSGVQVEAAANKADNADSIFRAATKISNATDLVADGIVIHPLDYQDFRLNKDGNGQYFGGGYFTGQYGNGGVMENPPLWGLRTVVSPVVEKGKPLVGSFSNAATLYRKGGVRIETTNTDGTDFVDGKVKTRVDERIALAVRQPLAFVKVTLSSVTA
ncbi:phage major capsid protein [Nocardiaceae bacterium NPDC056970]